ncbi:MAG: DUF721 domain-containing protein [Phycisphaeraceae bacterium]|nr:DUF721 domain-containing protein [Phycisphaerales bacterium]MCB9859874.1 DUF721 domain-containing protein [Phycisphaeraceae bacterium]
MTHNAENASDVDPVLEQRLIFARSLVRKSRSATVHDLVQTQQRSWKAKSQASIRADQWLDAALEVWMRLFPDETGQLCRPVGLRHGTLVVHCADIGARHTVDRLLRAGAIRQLKDLLPDVQQVHTVVKPVESHK